MIRDRIRAIAQYTLLFLLLLLLWLASGSEWILGLLAFMILILPVSILVNLYVRKHIHGKLVLPTTAAKKTACMGSIFLENKAWLPAAKIYCRIGMINDLTGEENVLEIISGLGPKRKSTRDFLLEGEYCGRVYVYVQSVKILDYWGLFAVNVPMKAAARITILPELFSCDVAASPVCAVSDENAVSRKGEDRTEVFQLREYRSGDDIRQIHWKLSSKLDKLIIREASQSVSRSLLVFWDKRDDATPENMDAMAEATVSICQALCDKGVTYDLCWTEQDELELRQIRDADTLLQTIPALVTQRGTAECQTPNIAEYGRVICISANPFEEETDEKTVRLICSDMDFVDGRGIVFSSQNYAERLKRLEF